MEILTISLFVVILSHSMINLIISAKIRFFFWITKKVGLFLIKKEKYSVSIWSFKFSEHNKAIEG